MGKSSKTHLGLFSAMMNGRPQFSSFTNLTRTVKRGHLNRTTTTKKHKLTRHNLRFSTLTNTDYSPLNAQSVGSRKTPI